MRPPKSKDLGKILIKELENRGFHVETGEFGADMQVSLENDGPFTIVLVFNSLSKGLQRLTLLAEKYKLKRNYR